MDDDQLRRLKNAGLDVKELSDAIQLLSSLSDEELHLLAKVQKSANSKGITEDNFGTILF